MAKSKAKATFFCKECGAESPKWFGQCPSCQAWNTMVEAPSAGPAGPRGRGKGAGSGVGRRGGPGAGAAAARGFAGGAAAEPPRPLTHVHPEEDRDPDRVTTGIAELDRALGGGLVPGSVVLLGGDPGVGKSTLALQAAARVADAGRPVLYVTGEESRRQVQLRARRLDGVSEKVLLAAESSVEAIGGWVAETRPSLVVVDSIQTAHTDEADGAPGSVSQIRECGYRLHTVAKATGSALLLIGHVTKDGTIAGPRLLEHMVDTVLYLEGERMAGYRILRAVKNRFGSTDEIGLFEMRDRGLVEVIDPSRVLTEHDGPRGNGTVVVPVIEGTRPLLVEVQALVTPTAYSLPQRVATGIDAKRLPVLLAVLQKHAGIDLSAHNVFVNVVSGIRLHEPAADLGVMAAVVSSLRDRAVPQGIACVGEVGLGGEVRQVSQLERRVSEAVRVGLERVVVPRAGKRDLGSAAEAALPVANVAEALVACGLFDADEPIGRGARGGRGAGGSGGRGPGGYPGGGGPGRGGYPGGGRSGGARGGPGRPGPVIPDDDGPIDDPMLDELLGPPDEDRV